MLKLTKRMAAVCVTALLGVMLAGCSGQQASSSAEASAASSAEASATPSGPEQISAEQLVSELEGAKGAEYQSVTIDMDANISMDYSAILSMNEEGAAAESADTASGESADAASGESADAASESAPMEIGTKAKILFDVSGADVRMYMTMDALGVDYELYMNGDKAVVVLDGEAYNATLEEVGLADFKSVDSIVNSQTGNIAEFADAIQSAEKSVEGDETVYTVVCDPAKFLQLCSSITSLSGLQGFALEFDSVQMVYRMNAEGYLSGATIMISSPAYSLNSEMAFSNYNATEVPDAPEATKDFSEISSSAITSMNAEGALEEEMLDKAA